MGLEHLLCIFVLNDRLINNIVAELLVVPKRALSFVKYTVIVSTSHELLSQSGHILRVDFHKIIFDENILLLLIKINLFSKNSLNDFFALLGFELRLFSKGFLSLSFNELG